MDKLPSENSSSFTKLLKKIWGPVFALIGIVTTVVQFIQLWQGDQQTVTWVTAVIGFIILVFFLIWIGFSQREKADRLLVLSQKQVFQPLYPRLYMFARFCLIVVSILAVISSFLLYNQIKSEEAKVVVVLTNFDGPEPDNYRVTETIWENLYSALKNYNNVSLILDNTSIKTFPDAQIIGNKHNATIVIWGWYAITAEKAEVDVHFDLLKHPDLLPTEFVNQPAIKTFTITSFENFSYQDQLSSEMTFMSLMTVGLVRYSSQDWDGAISSFNSALEYTNNPQFIQEAHNYIDLSNVHISMPPPIPNYSVILVASQNIAQGSKIFDHVSFTQIPNDKVLPEMYTKLDSVVGKIAEIPIDQGEIITSSMVIDPSEVVNKIPGPAWAAVIPPGVIAYSIPTCRFSILALGTETIPTSILCPTLVPTP